MHPATVALLKWFDYDHLPAFLQIVVVPYRALAWELANVDGGAETTVALRKLLESKDAAVRAMIVASA